jgi:hypothetical protein
MILFYQNKSYKLTDQEAQAMFPELYIDGKKIVNIDYDPHDYLNYKRKINYISQSSVVDNVISGNRFKDVDFLRLTCGWNIKMIDDFNLSDYDKVRDRKVRECICYAMALNCDIDLFDIIEKIDIRLTELDLIIRNKIENNHDIYAVKQDPDFSIFNIVNGVRILFKPNSFLICHWISGTRVVKILNFRDNVIINKYSKFRTNYEPIRWI